MTEHLSTEQMQTIIQRIIVYPTLLDKQQRSTSTTPVRFKIRLWMKELKVTAAWYTHTIICIISVIFLQLHRSENSHQNHIVMHLATVSWVLKHCSQRTKCYL